MRNSILAILIFAFTGCKVYTFSGTSIPPEVKTVSVSFFENNAPVNSPLLSQVFTEKLKSKFLSETNLSLVESGGDFDFSGVISNYVIAPVAAQSTDNAQLNRLTITVKAALSCEVKPALDFDQPFFNFQDFDATTNFNSVESELIDEITTLLVQQIFNKAAINW